MVYTFDQPDAQAPQDPILRNLRQSRDLSRRLVRRHHPQGTLGEQTPPKLQEDTWELYDTRNDFSLVNDVAASNPAKLKEMQALFMKEAIKYRVLPIDDRLLERVNAATAGRPDLMGDRTSLTLSEGMVG